MVVAAPAALPVDRMNALPMPVTVARPFDAPVLVISAAAMPDVVATPELEAVASITPPLAATTSPENGSSEKAPKPNIV